MAKEKKWILKDPVDVDKVDQLASELGIDRVLATLLVQRGITTFEQAHTFFRPQLSSLHDPFLMKDMDKAVDRLGKAVRGGEKILVYGDYDVDGTTAVALVYSFLRRITDKVDFYIPDRYDEGYGVSRKGVDYAVRNGFTLIIVLDCGIKAVEMVAEAKSKGVEMIICDHHLQDEVLPDAVAVLDPKRHDNTYPFDDLSGCGVGFKLAQAYSIANGMPFDDLIPLLDLLVISIASDLVSVIGENRILAHYGLIQLNDSPRRGLQALIDLSKLETGHVSFDDIIFKIGPRINAAGRMETGRLAVELLTATDDAKAKAIADKINSNNDERKRIDREITKEAMDMVRAGDCLAHEYATIVYNPNWNKGVVGIVASRLVEAFYKPSFVLTRSNGFVTGSARSVRGFDLYDSIESCADLLENFGGHTYAAGLTLKESNLPEFAARIENYVKNHITEEMETQIVDIDCRLDFSQITPKFCRILRQFQPFGPGNNMPVFLTENVYNTGDGRRVGGEGKHLRLNLIQEEQPYNPKAAIGFNMAEYYNYINEGNPIDVCYSVVENYFNKVTSIQLRIKDIHKREELI